MVSLALHAKNQYINSSVHDYVKSGRLKVLVVCIGCGCELPNAEIQHTYVGHTYVGP